MTIIRDSETDFTAELTGTDQALWLHIHNKMAIEEAVTTVNMNEGRSLYVRLPLEVKTTDDLTQYLRSSLEYSLSTAKDEILELTEELF